MLLPARLSGAVWGHLVGDALGVPYEHRSPGLVGRVTWGAQGTHGQPPGTWSDDGALMLALLDSLIAAGFDPEDQARRTLAWRHEGRYAPGALVFDVGGTTAAALGALGSGVAAEEAAPDGEHASGNGSLMRILPLGLVERELPDPELADHAHRASRVTHGHPRCQVACALYALIVRDLLREGADRDVVISRARARLRDVYAGGGMAAHLSALDELEAWSGRTGSGFVLDAFWSAWDAFAGAETFSDAVVRAIELGNDTDTTAAIAGGLAGAWLGVDAIPPDWLGGLRDRTTVVPLVDGLVETAGYRTSTSHPLPVDRLDLSGVPALGDAGGRIGLTFVPGKRRDGESGPHWRDLPTDATRLRAVDGVDALVLFVEDWELAACGVTAIGDVLAAGGVELIRHPIDDDHGLPSDPAAYRSLIREVLARVRAGQHVVLACRAGLDRTGTAAACCLVEAGLEPREGIRRVHAARRSALTRPDQQAFVRAWPRRSHAPRARA